MSLLFCIGVVLTADHYGPPQLIGINGKHFYMDHASPIDDSILYVSIHDHEYHDELGRRKVDTRPPSIFRKAEIHV